MNEEVSWNFFIENIKNELNKLVEDFQGGNLRNCLPFWKSLTSDQWVLNIIAGMKIKLESFPKQINIPKPIVFELNEAEIIEQKIQEMLAKGIIKRAPKGDITDEFISNIFIRKKKDGGHRIILNLKKFNDHVEKQHFKMQSLFSAIELMEEGCYMASIDWKDAYYTVPIDPKFQKYLRFYWKGEKFQYTVLPNGLTSGPKDFTKITKVFFAKLRELGFLNSSYIDDSFLMGDNLKDCRDNVICTVQNGLKAGFTVHPEKSVFIPTHIIEYLGFILNSIRMIVQLNKRKTDELLILCKKLLVKQEYKIQEIAELTGKMVAALPGVQYGNIYYRMIDNDKNESLKKRKGDFSATMTLSVQSKEDLQWWIEKLPTAYRPIKVPKIEIVIKTDASDKGWGGVRDNMKTNGIFSENEMKLHINHKELLAVLFSLKSLCPNVTKKHIQIMSDNMTTIAYINNQGGTKRTCNQITRNIWEWAIQRQILLSATHIPGIKNVEADRESRLHKKSHSEFMLNPEIFERLQKIWGKVSIDLFASRMNFQVENYFSWKPDPGAKAINALSQNWETIELGYAFPPFSIIGKVLKKVQEDQADIILIVPVWPTQPWFSKVLRLIIDCVFLLPRAKNTLIQMHGLESLTKKNLQLMACKLSGNIYKRKDFQTKLRTFYCHHGDQKLNHSIMCISDNGDNFVKNKNLIQWHQMTKI